MGEFRVKHAIDLLLKQNVEGLISFGTAGALREGIKPGDIIIPEKIIDANGNTRSVSASWRDNVLQKMEDCPATIHRGDIVNSDSVISTAEDKQALHEKTAAIAVDMESGVIMAAATRHNLPTLILRVIVDDASMTIPDSVLRLTDAYGQVAIPALIGDIILQPMLIGKLIKLGKAFKAARQSMQWIGAHTEQVFIPN